MSSQVDYAGAAADLNLPEAWLRNNIGSLPHRKYGRHVRFTADDLQAIRDIHAADQDVSHAVPGVATSGLQTSRSRRRARGAA